MDIHETDAQAAKPAPGAPPMPDELKPTGSDARRPVKLVASLIVVIAVLLAIGVLPRLASSRQNANAAPQAAAASTVSVISVTRPPASTDISLPGTMAALDQTTIDAQANGYVRKWLVDIGDRVTAGQTLALISTPDLDQQLLQARAELQSEEAAYAQALSNVTGLRAKLSQAQANLSRARADYEASVTDLAKSQADLAHAKDAVARQQAQVVQAQTNMNLAKVTSARYNSMLKDGAVDQQSADVAQAAYDTSAANVQAVQAALSAARDDVHASEEAVNSARANVAAYQNGIQSGEADVRAAIANVQSGDANISAARANVASSKANVGKMAALQSFQRVTAPFSGVITARDIDTGSLVTVAGARSVSGAGGSAAGVGVSGSPAGVDGAASAGGQSGLFSLAKTDRLRVYINVPQADVDDVRPGEAVSIRVSALGDRRFTGQVVRTADAIDPVSRTLVTEVDVNNSGGALEPGMFVQATLKVQRAPNVVLVPDSALITRTQNPQVALVDDQRRVRFITVAVGRDFGKTIEITSGLRQGDTIVVSPSDGLYDGEKVSPVETAASNA